MPRAMRATPTPTSGLRPFRVSARRRAPLAVLGAKSLATARENLLTRRTPLWQYRAMLGETPNPFSLTRAALGTCGRGKSNSRAGPMIGPGSEFSGERMASAEISDVLASVPGWS